MQDVIARRRHESSGIKEIVEDKTLCELAMGIRKSRLRSCVSGSVVGEHTPEKFRWAMDVAAALHAAVAKESVRRRAARSRIKKGQIPRANSRHELDSQANETTHTQALEQTDVRETKRKREACEGTTQTTGNAADKQVNVQA